MYAPLQTSTSDTHTSFFLSFHVEHCSTIRLHLARLLAVVLSVNGINARKNFRGADGVSDVVAGKMSHGRC